MVVQKPRENAARILLRHAEGRQFLEEVLDRELHSVRLSRADQALVQEICYGTIRWRATLDWLIDRQTPRQRPNLPAQILLRIGLYQLFWLDRVPPHAAVHETVEAARALQLDSQIPFLNAVLRNYTRQLDATRAELLELRLRDPALGWSHPRWLVDRWKERFDPKTLQSLFAWNNSPALSFARINTLKADPAQVINAWRTEGVHYDFTRLPWIDENLVFCLRHLPPLDRLPSFHSGWYYLQDPSTLLAVHLLNPQPGEEILDLCAAPGGKATYIAQRIDNDGSIVASEPDRPRRDRLQANVDRLGADVCVVEPGDPRASGPFDAILVDAPCSNTGVLRRRLDARWRLTSAEIQRCQSLQRQLLDSALPLLKPGGRLVYSTCSIEPDENEKVLEPFLADHPGLVLDQSRLLNPAVDQVDGAFAAVIRKPKP